MSGPRVGALFAGYGGLELALHDVFDAEPAWFSEFDKAPSAILEAHWPGVPNLGDVTKVEWTKVAPVDIIAGGSPCQDLSHAGKRKGMRAGTRSGLWASMCDAIDIIRPSLVVWENVRGALSADADSDMEPCPGCVGGGDDGPVLRALGRVLGDLAELGYDAAWTGLRAADVGAPHGRFRVFVLAWPAADADRQQLQGVGHVPRLGGGSDALADVRLSALPGTAERASDARRLTLLPTPAVNDMGAGKTVDAWDAWTDRMQAKHSNGNGHGASLAIEALRLLPTPLSSVRDSNAENLPEALRGRRSALGSPDLLPTPRATRGGSGTETMYGLGAERSDGDRPQGQVLLPTPNASLVGPHGERGARTLESRAGRQIELPDVIAGTDFGVYAPAIARWEAITRPAPSPTEPTGKGGAQRLSPRFVEWLMGLPEGWVTDVGISRNDQLKALGNGVVPQQCAAASRHLLTVRAAVLAAGRVA